jgi:uncharacterized iron-regulated membrane protein
LRARRWFVWHSWIGITAGLMLFVICWSGAFAVFSEEIDWLLNPAERVEPAGALRSWGEWQAAVERAHPEARVDAILFPRTLRSAAEIWIETPDGRLLRTYVNPFTAQVTGQTSYFNVQRFFRSLHMCLFDPGSLGAGYYFVMAFSLVLVASLVTSLLFYKRWWRRFLAWKSHHNRRAFWSDAHKLVGLWSLWFIALMAITGIWYLIEFAGFGFAYAELQPVERPGTQKALPTDELMARARAIWPELAPTQVYLPGGYYGDVAVFHGNDGSLLVRDRANALMLDAFDGSLALVRTAADLGWPARWVDTADPLHFGNFGGLLAKALWCIFGLLLAALCLTGAYLHVQRQRRHHEQAPRHIAVTSASVASATVLTVAAIGAVQEISRYGNPGPPMSVWVFISIWTIATVAILLIWARSLR